MPSLLQPSDRAFPTLRGEVAALGEDHERVVLVEVAGEVADLGLHVAARGRGLAEMNLLGSRVSSTPRAGSQASVSLSTTRGSRPYQCISAYISVNESPGPACRQNTSSGSPG